jgi:hypothetical protein
MRTLWYTLSITSTAFLAGIEIGAYSGISMTALNVLLYGTLVWFITSLAIYLWATRRRHNERAGR